VHVILLTAALLGVGILLNILACALPFSNGGASWYNLFSVLFYVLAPIPVVLCGGGSSDPFSEEGSSLPDFGFFLTGALAASGIGLPAVLLGAGVIAYQTLIMSIAGSLVCAVAVVVMLKYVLGGQSDREMF
jgi:hypothetical protein